MKVCIYDDGKVGLLRDGEVRDISAIFNRLPPARYAARRGGALIAALVAAPVNYEDHLDEARASTRDLIIDVPGRIEFASAWYTLEPGDVIFTGTPSGVGPIRPGDRITASIGRIGSMEVPVRGG